MIAIDLNIEPFPKSEIPKVLGAHGILTNHLAEVLFAHPAFSTETAGVRRAVIASPEELGLAGGGTLSEIRGQAARLGLRPCPVSTGLFLRLAWMDQAESGSSVLSGTHRAPEGSVTVLSDPLEPEDSFPKGLYVRRVNGTLWLRGYVCGADYAFDGGDLFAFDGGAMNETGS